VTARVFHIYTLRYGALDVANSQGNELANEAGIRNLLILCKLTYFDDFQFQEHLTAYREKWSANTTKVVGSLSLAKAQLARVRYAFLGICTSLLLRQSAS
jgi:hypothetical protein